MERANEGLQLHLATCRCSDLARSKLAREIICGRIFRKICISYSSKSRRSSFTSQIKIFTCNQRLSVNHYGVSNDSITPYSHNSIGISIRIHKKSNNTVRVYPRWKTSGWINQQWTCRLWKHRIRLPAAISVCECINGPINKFITILLAGIQKKNVQQITTDYPFMSLAFIMKSVTNCARAFLSEVFSLNASRIRDNETREMYAIL